MVRKRPSASFNPCCYGYRSSTVTVKPDAFERSFNPCCYGYRSSTSEELIWLPVLSAFQSLLLWIPLLNDIIARNGQASPVVSILVVMDTAPQRCPACWTVWRHAEFQSLLLWIPLLN